jgi:hypothetical protein
MYRFWMASTSRIMAASFGAMPLTSTLRLISPLRRSSGFLLGNQGAQGSCHHLALAFGDMSESIPDPVHTTALMRCIEHFGWH